jgi:valyl-tRNA synthetase
LSDADALPKGYEPEAVESRWVQAWEEAGVGHADASSSATPFCMVTPPPNVTGSLHIGHALNVTIQDILARWKRMAGFDVLWLPGTDHAGIATQNVVERQLAKEGVHRNDLGREEFEKRVWEWKKEYGDRILSQMRLMGLTCDWERERFTLDPGLSRAVRRVFVELYESGSIYRGEYLVNWCPRCETAISDLEVTHQEVTGKMWKIRYPLLAAGDEAGGGDAPKYLTVETTRPETMLGDTALAAHPQDTRYSELIGSTAVLPVIGRELTIIADDFVDPEFGTGLVKVTPAHDPNDYEAGLRNDLDRVKVIGKDGRMTQEAGPFAGLDRFECREKLLERLQAEGLLESERPHDHAVGHCQRCETIIEPLVSTQWFVRMEPLAKPALEAVEDGRIRFLPEHQVKVYREWLTNIRDWCISRQLWWGHRIPAWYCTECDEITVAEEEPKACSCGGALEQESDVLDTWFSSALWPFSTLGWPEETEDLARYYPTDLLVTAYDILFFWVARMIFMGLRFQDEVPFPEVLLHGLVRDEHGDKMSKSKGNALDPVEAVGQYGADALRFTLASMATPGTDMKLSTDRLAGYRTFCNKLWNAARFALMNMGDEETSLQASADAADPKPATLADRWILSRTSAIVPQIEKALSSYRFDEMCHVLYHFIWHEFCDWYLEMSKLVFWNEDADELRATRGTLMAVLEALLRALHPVMPFITEEIWSRLPGERELVARAPWIACHEEWIDDTVEAQVKTLQGLVTEVRRLRAEFSIEPGKKVSLLLVCEDDSKRSDLADLVPYIGLLARAESVEVVAQSGTSFHHAARAAVVDVEIVLSLDDVLDIEGERCRIEKSLDGLSKELGQLAARLENRGFLDKAPPEVVEQVRSRRDELAAETDRLKQHLAALSS